MTQIILGLLISLVSPLFILPIENLLPYPHFIEEAVKLVVVVVMIKIEKQIRKGVASWALMAGFLFTISESILYLTNIFALGNYILFPKRLVLTGGLHTGTVMLMYFLGRKNYIGLAAGFIGAIIIHYFFNLWVARL